MLAVARIRLKAAGQEAQDVAPLPPPQVRAAQPKASGKDSESTR